MFYSPKLKNGPLLTSIALRDRVPYVHVEHIHELVDVLFMCRDAGIKGERTEIIERHSKTLSRKDASLYMWHCVPGIGESRARELNKIVRFGSFVKSCMTIGVDITMEERGIPKKLTEESKGVLRRRCNCAERGNRLLSRWGRKMAKMQRTGYLDCITCVPPSR